MSRPLYSPRLSDDVVRLLYREGQRRRLPMTRLADLLLRQELGRLTGESTTPHFVRDQAAEPSTTNDGVG